MKRTPLTILLPLLLCTNAAFAADPLPSWNEGPAKQGIISFVEKVTKVGSPAFIQPAERIATFDNDGTLWCEQPVPVQLYFALDRVKALAPQHPEWKTKEPFASLLKGDVTSALAGGDHALLELVMATHAGNTTVEFEQIVKDWIATARHPKTGKLYTEMVYQPMLEVLAYLRANGFKTFIVSGGGIEFMRPWAERVYGIPPEQVVGSSVKTRFEMRNGKPVLVRLPDLNFNDDKGDKPVGINQHIGRRPIAAFGNSVGDQQMLEYTQGGSGARFEMLVLHDDAAREYAYGPALGLPDVKLGAFTPALYDEAKKSGWTVVSMKNDWKTVFPAEAPAVTAIDILLEPDAAMLRHAEANNARLLKVYPQGFALDATHRPHITLVQRFVRTADLEKVVRGGRQGVRRRQCDPDEAGGVQVLLRPGRRHRRRGHLREADAGDPQAASGHHRRREAVYGGQRTHRRVHRPARRRRHRRGHHQVRVDVRAGDVRREVQSARQHRRRPNGLPRHDARREVRVVPLLARRRGRVPTRPVRHRCEAAQEWDLKR